MSDGQVEFIPFEDKRLGRHIRHDPRSRRFATPRRARPTTDVRHRNYGRKLHQRIGACTGYTGAHCLNCAPARQALRPRATFGDADALRFYSGATTRDPWEGVYPPTDTGSSGLAVCETMLAEGIITRYEWSFGFEHGLESIQDGALMQGTWWTTDMFDPDPTGRVRPTGGDAGGHEYLWVGVELRTRLAPSQNRSWFLNSWGPWGKGGYFWMTWEDHMMLLERDGDLIRPIVA